MKRLLIFSTLLSIQFCLAQNINLNDPIAFANAGKKIIAHYTKTNQKAYIHKVFPEAYLQHASGVKMLASLEKFAIDYIKANPDVLVNMEKFEEDITMDAIQAQIKYLIQENANLFLKEAEAQNIAIDAKALEALAALQTSTLLLAAGGKGTFLKNVINYSLEQIDN